MVILELFKAASAACIAPFTLACLSDTLSSALLDSYTVDSSSGCSCINFYPLTKGRGRPFLGVGCLGCSAFECPYGSGDILLDGFGNNGLRCS